MIVVVTGSNKGTGITVSSSSGGVSVIPSPDPIVLGNQPNPVQITPDITGLVAADVALDTTNFNNNLDGNITDVQLLADAVDELTTSAVDGTMLPTNYVGSILLDLQSGRDYGIVDVTSNLIVSADATGIINGGVAQIGFLGNGTNTLDVSAFNQLDTGTGALTFDNTLNTLNAFAFIRWLNRSYWNLLSQYTYTGPVTLSAPGSFVANSTTVSSITLTWTTVANASSYMLEWSANGTSGWTQIGGTLSQATITYNHTTLTSGVQYFYRISSIGDGVNYLTSGYVTANDTVNVPTQLSAPSISPAQFDSNTVRFTITPVTNNAGYRYRTGISSGVYGSPLDLPTDTAYVDVDGTTGQTIYAQFMTLADGVNYLNSNYGTEVSQLLTANQAPVASSVNITGSVTLGATLTGNYTYSDNESDLEGTSTFRWLRGITPISGATNSTYVIVIADQGQTLYFEVTPVAQTGTTPGTAVSSVGTAIPANVAPVLTQGSFTGTPQEGQVLTGSLGSYSDADGDAAGTHTYQWYRDTNNTGNDGTPISGATSINYTCVTADINNYLYRGDTPIALTGATPGTEVFTTYSSIVTNTETDLNFLTYISNVVKIGTIYTAGTATNWGDLISDETFASNFAFRWEVAAFTAGAGESVGINIDTDVTYSSYAGWILATFRNTVTSVQIYIGSTLQTNVTVAIGDLLELKRVGTTVILNRFTGGSWSTVHTYSGTYSQTVRFNFRGYYNGTAGSILKNPKYL